MGPYLVLAVMCRYADVHDVRPPYIIEYPLYIKQNDRVIFKWPFARAYAAFCGQKII